MLPEQTRIEAIGTARAAVSAELYPESAGLVNRVAFTAGQRVGKGKPLVELDARRERLAVQLADVAVREAAQLLGRYRRIEDTGALSASQIDAGVTALDSAKIELSQAKVALSDRTIRAPFAGYMGLPQIDPGDRITPQTLIGQIDNRSTLFVDFEAPESVFAELKPGSVVTLRPYTNPGETIEAKVQAVGSGISLEARSFTVRTVIDNAGDRFRPGMSFAIGFASPGRARPAVPEAAVVWGGNGSFLWVVRDGRARRVSMTIVARRDGQVLVDAPIAPTDMVITRGVQKVRDGQRVRLVTQKPAPPAKAQVAPRETAAAPRPRSTAPAE